VVARAVDRNAREDDENAEMDQLGCRCCLKGNVLSINIPTPKKGGEESSRHPVPFEC